MSVTCRELIEYLAGYLEGELPEDERSAFEEHLAACPSCVAYLNTYREAIRAGRAVLRADESPEQQGLPEPLVQAVLAARARRA